MHSACFENIYICYCIYCLDWESVSSLGRPVFAWQEQSIIFILFCMKGGVYMAENKALIYIIALGLVAIWMVDFLVFPKIFDKLKDNKKWVVKAHSVCWVIFTTVMVAMCAICVYLDEGATFHPVFI